MEYCLGALILLFLLVADVASSDSVYKYWPPPPPPHTHHARVHKSSPHHAHVHRPSPHVHKHAARPKRIVVTGHVYCDTCKDGRFKEPLQGVTVGVICENGKVERSFYGITNKGGNFKVKLEGYDHHKHGATKSCHVKLISPSYGTSCMVPTNLHGGKVGAPLHVKSKNLHEFILEAGPFSYIPTFKSKKCYHNYENFLAFFKHDSKTPL